VQACMSEKESGRPIYRFTNYIVRIFVEKKSGMDLPDFTKPPPGYPPMYQGTVSFIPLCISV